MNRAKNFAVKRRIPKHPCLTSICNFKLDIEGESVIMRVNCRGCSNIDQGRDDVCWANLVKGISETAMPDRIVLMKKRTVLCDRRYVSIIRNAALLMRRLRKRIEGINDTAPNLNRTDEAQLLEIVRALLYDVPQLITDKGTNSSCRAQRMDEESEAIDLLAEKQRLGTSLS